MHTKQCTQAQMGFCPWCQWWKVAQFAYVFLTSAPGPSNTLHNIYIHCKNELHLMHFCNGTYLSQNHEHLRHIKHIRYKITVTCSTSAMPQAHGALYITSAKIGWGAWSASCMGISRYLLSLTRMEWNWAPPQAHGSCTMRLNILNPCAWCEHRFYSVELQNRF